MPLLYKLMENRFQSQTIKANVRFCDSSDNRHNSAYNNLCCYASPQITALVPEEQRHKKLRNGVESSHYSFNAIQSASLLLRHNKRFESIESDRQENIVDVLNDICHKIKDSAGLMTGLMERIVAQIESEGTVCTLLKQICDAFRASMISESPQMEIVARNTAFIMDYTSNQLSETQKLRNDFNCYRLDHLSLLETTFDRNSDYLRQLVNNGVEMKSLFNDFCSENLKELKEMKEKNTTELSSVKYEIQIINTSVEKLDANIQMSGLELKQELVDIRHEISQIKEEVISLKEAIVDILPNKLMEIFHNISCDQTSELGSDVELIESQQLEALMENNCESN